MPINNKKHISLVDLEETASVKWLYYKPHSAMCYAQGFNAGYHSLRHSKGSQYILGCYMVEMIH